MMTPEEKILQESILTNAYNDYEKKLSKHAFFRISDSTNSKDLVQKTFMKTWMYMVRGGRIETMKAFLYHILNQLIIDEYRIRKTTSLDEIIEKGFEPSVDYSQNIFDYLDGREALLLIQKLPLPYKKVIHMRYVQDLTLKEMSLITNRKQSTLAVQVHRGIKKLKLLYKAQ